MDYKTDIAKYTASINDKAVDAIVKFCGIALKSRDASLVSCTDDAELDRIRKGFAAKVLSSARQRQTRPSRGSAEDEGRQEQAPRDLLLSDGGSQRQGQRSRLIPDRAGIPRGAHRAGGPALFCLPQSSSLMW